MKNASATDTHTQFGDFLITEIIPRLEADGIRSINFRKTTSPFSPPITISNAIKATSKAFHEVDSTGEVSLKRRISEFQNHHFASNFNPEDVIVGPGLTLLSYLLIQVFHDYEFLTPTPTKHQLYSQLKTHAANFTSLDCTFENGWKLTATTLEETLKVSNSDRRPVLFLASPGEFGISYSRSEMDAISAVISAYNGVIVTDESFAPIHHYGAQVSVSQSYPKGTIVLSSPAQWCAIPGWQIGAVLVPESLGEIKTKLSTLIPSTFGGTSAPIQRSARLAYTVTPKIDHYFKGQRETLNGVGRYVQGQLNSLGVNVHIPESGCSLLCDFSPLSSQLKSTNITNERILCEKIAMETGVLLWSGKELGSLNSTWTVGLSYGNFDGDPGLDAYTKHLGIDVFLMRKMAADIIEGCKRLTEWIKTLDQSDQ